MCEVSTALVVPSASAPFWLPAFASKIASMTVDDVISLTAAFGINISPEAIKAAEIDGLFSEGLQRIPQSQSRSGAVLSGIPDAVELLEMLQLEDDHYLEALCLMGLHHYIKAHKDHLALLDDDRVLVDWLDAQPAAALPKDFKKVFSLCVFVVLLWMRFEPWSTSLDQLTVTAL